MFKDDYVLRHIRLFVQTIARILGLIKDGDLNLAQETIELAFADSLGLSLNDFLSYPDERVREFLYFGENEVMGLNRTALASALLLQAGRIFAVQGRREKALACFEKSIRLLLETHLADETDPDMPEFAATIEELLGELALEDLHDETLAPLSFYFDRFGEPWRAHACLQILLARRPADPDLRDMATSFYEYLLDDETHSKDEPLCAAARAALGNLEDPAP